MPKLFAIVASAVAAIAAPAGAATYTFDLTSSGGNGSGTIITATDASAGASLVTALQGTFDGGAIALLAPGTYPIYTNNPALANDNLFSAATPYFTTGGLSFSANGLNYNLYRNAGGVRFCNSREGTCALFETVAFSASSVDAVPEPATWAMLLAGFGLSGAVLRRRRTAVAFA